MARINYKVELEAEKLNHALTTQSYDAAMRSNAQLRCDIDTLSNCLVAARTEAKQQRAFSAQLIEEHGRVLAAKEAEITKLAQQGKEARMQILRMMNRSSLDKGNGVVTATVESKVVPHSTPRMQAAREEAMRTGKSVKVQS